MDGGSCHSDELDYKSDWVSDCEGEEEGQMDVVEYNNEAEEVVERISTGALTGSSGEEELMTVPHLIVEDGLNATESGQEMGQEKISEYTFLSYDQCDFNEVELEKGEKKFKDNAS